MYIVKLLKWPLLVYFFHCVIVRAEISLTNGDDTPDDLIVLKSLSNKDTLTRTKRQSYSKPYDSSYNPINYGGYGPVQQPRGRNSYGVGYSGYGRGYDQTPNTYMNSWIQKSQSGTGIKGGPKKQTITAIMIPYSGCSPLPLPPYMSYQCKGKQCELKCNSQYNFGNGEQFVKVSCDGTNWIVYGPTDGTIPNCQPICIPPCQNNGICWEPGKCKCPENFSGALCETKSGSVCSTRHPLVKNSNLQCKNQFCSAVCLPGFKFSDGSQIANIVCQEGQWIHKATGSTKMPDCEPTCNPACQNDGQCVAYNICQCEPKFRGDYCQYNINRCNITTNGFNGNFKCAYDQEEASCTLTCPKLEGLTIEGNIDLKYTCKYATGDFEPKPIPKCIIPPEYSLYHSSSAEFYREVSKPIVIEASISNLQTGYKVREKLLELIKKYQNMKENEWLTVYGAAVTTPAYYKLYQTGSVDVMMNHAPKKSFCASWNSNNVKTFDGLIYKTPLSCSHTFVTDTTDATFDIALKACPYGSAYGCPHQLDIYWQSVVYTMQNINGSVQLATNTKTLTIPVQVYGMKVVASAQNIQLTLEAIGLQIIWDRHQYVAVYAGPALWNKVGGLCGSLDGDPDNDIVSRKGVPIQTIHTFVDAWKVSHKEDGCSIENENEHEYSLRSCEQKDRSKALETCRRLLTNSKITDCLANYNYEALLQNCLEDYCRCSDQEQPEKCNCAAIALLAEECVFRGIELTHGWRDLEICPINCTNGRIYMPCGPEVEATCDSADIPKASKCVEGCFCPTGTVRHEDSCIPSELCPCFMKGRQFAPESVVKKHCNTCVCKNAKWECTDEECSARCGAVGDPHYQTFDGKRYNFMGKCSYYLLKTKDITVETENVACSGAISENLNMEVTADDPSCTKSLTIKFTTSNGEPNTVKLSQAMLVTINGQELSKFPKVLGRGEVLLRQASSEFVTVEFPSGLRIYWDGKSRAYIDAPPSLRNQTSGLCGTFNSNTQDDFLTPEGDIETGVEPFADKWRTKDTCDFPAQTKDGPHPCSVDPSRNELAEKHCAWILDDIFQDCHWSVETEQYYEDCLYDVCACKEELSKCYCPLLSAYGDECSRQGIKTGWRAHVKECATKCPLGQVYDECGNSCTRSCEDVSLSAACDIECIEGCRCPHGSYLNNNNECVPQSMCQCTFDGIVFKPGYKEVRQGLQFLDLCTCSNATWQCEPATEEDERNYPPAADLRNKCAKTPFAEFSTCAPLEPKTCKNMDVYVPDMKDCHPDCVCMPDYVLDTATKTCVLASNCSCHHAGKSYSDGAQMKDKCNLCMCQSGQWECSKKVCDSTCSVWGDSHFTTFDNHDFDFQGACDYILSKGINEHGQGYTIIVQNVLCGTLGVTCSKSVEIAISGNITDSILLNAGNNVQTAGYNNSIVANVRELINSKTHGAFHVYKTGLFIVVEVLELGLQVKWDEGTRVYVKLSKEWKGKVSGLCGNYNDNSMDDMKTPTQSLEISPLIFGHSWKVQNFCAQPTQPIDACKEHPERETWAQLKCDILKSETFQSCHYAVPVEPFLKRCMFDSCACDQGGDCECLCTAVAAYAHACSQKDISIRWRTSHFCPMQCDAHCSNYDACTPACGLETCDNFLDHENSESMCNEEHCTEGCKVVPCEVDMIYKNDSYLECVPKSECKPVCLILNGTTYYEGDIMYQDQCATCHCSKKKQICSGVKCSELVPTHKLATTTENPLNADIEPQCVQGWTRWYDNDGQDSQAETQLNDEELLPQYDRFESIYGTCAPSYMKNIECRVLNSNKSAEFMDENVSCSLEKGLTCIGNCHDYELRVYCQCFEDETPLVLTTEKPSIGVICDNKLAEYKEYPGDCHKFLHCQPKSVNGDWHYVEKTCGESMMFNPTINVCDHIAVVQRIKSSCGTQAELKTKPQCAEGLVESDCANHCENSCHYYKEILFKRGLCEKGEGCKPGCVPQTSRDCRALGKYWLNEDVCVDVDECPCMDQNEQYIQPHIPVAYGDTLCQCLSNEFNCIRNEVKTNVTADKLYAPVIQNLTQSPTLTCDSDNLVNLIDGDTPLADSVFSASSYLTDLHAAKFARLSSAANSWSPKINDQMQYLQVSFEQAVPLFGITISGNPEVNSYVKLFKILYSIDGEAYRYLVDTTDKPQLFDGPLEARESSTALFKIPVEAKSVRIYPLKWQGSIALRVDLLGCQQPTTTEKPVKQNQAETFEKLVIAECVDHFGIESETLDPKQLSASSVFNPNIKLIDQLKLSSPIGWKPLIINHKQFVAFDFLEPRNVTGIITKGGPDGWVTGYLVLFSKNKIFWNKILTNTGQARVFKGNQDANTEKTQIFDKPILTRYFKIIPISWQNTINMRIEVLGCFNADLKDEHEVTTAKTIETQCLSCPGIEIPNGSSKDCPCANGLYYNGKLCVERNYCPCVENYIPYAVGVTFVNKQCEECVCLLGGYSSCKPKKCPPCSANNTRSVMSFNCMCKCESCPKAQKLCPSSGDCIPEMLWCNGIQDCEDDEDATCHDKIEVNPNVLKNEKILSCPEPSCPPNMQIKFMDKKAPEMSSMFSSTTTKQILMTSDGNHIKKTKIVTSSEEYISAQDAGVEQLEENLCEEFACIPILNKNTTLECPVPNCPENYNIEVDVSNKNTGNCNYFCVLKPQKDDVCEISGSSITTFDGTEFKYSLCSHTLARDLTNSKWIVSIQVHCQNEGRRACHKNVIIQDLISSADLTIMPNMMLNFKGYEYSVQQLINSPICKASFIISNPGNSILIVSQRHGVWVLYSNDGFVKIGMSSKYIKSVDGLCGYYNGKANDDKRSPNGTILTSTVEFGDSWYDNNVLPEQCQRYTCPLDLQKKALAVCNTIKHPTFLKCDTSVNYKQYVSKCIENVCECLQAKHEDANSCKCNILQDFVKKCLAVNPNVQLDTWRTVHQCETSCPSPLVHSDCYKRRCELTCQDFNSENCPIVSDVCFTGCYCPEGTVRKGKTCVSVNECTDCACNSYGPASYFTYDHNNFTLNGNCTYLLSRDIVLPGVNTFEVHVSVDDCTSLPNAQQLTKGTTSCAKAYHILHGDHVLHLTHSHNKTNALIVNVDGVEPDKLPYKDSWVNLRLSHNEDILLLLPTVHIQLSVNFKTQHFSLEVPSVKYGGKLEGLCGNCNEKSRATSPQLSKNWLSDVSRLGVGINSCQDPPVLDLPKTNCKALLPGEKDPCLKLYDQKIFGKCHFIVDPKEYVEICQQETCKYGRTVNNTCNAFTAYNLACKRNGICVDWRGPELCPYDCPTTDMKYNACACEKTCETVLAMHEFDAFDMNSNTFVKTVNDSDMCDAFKQTEGCFCAPGKVLENGHCIAEKLCVKCDDGLHIPEESWQKDKCTTCQCNALGKIDCISQQCMVEENICAVGYQAKKIVNEQDCCPKFICVPEPKVPLAKLCLAPLMPVCGPGQHKQQKIGADGCPIYICVCKPKEECEELEPPRNLKPGEKLIIDEQGCCATQKIICDKKECVQETIKCNETYYELVMQDEPNDCCPTYTCELPKDKCIVKYVGEAAIVKNLFEKWTHPMEPCKHEVCIFTANGIAQVQTTIEECDTECGVGFTYMHESPTTTCCGKCVQTSCLFESKIYKPNEVWSSVDNCTHYTCDISSDNSLVVTTSKETCPDISSCEPDQILDVGGCCKYCKTVLENKIHCIPVLLAANETVELVGTSKGADGKCVNREPIEGFSECKGSCSSGYVFNKDTLGFERKCDCCSITSYKKLTVPLLCESGKTINHEIEVPSSCGCQSCHDSMHPDFDVRMNS